MKDRLLLKLAGALARATALLRAVAERFGPAAARLELDFAGAQRRSRGAGLAVLAAGALVLSFALWQSDLHTERIASLEGELTTLGVDRDADRRRAAAAPARGGDADERVRKANKVIRQLSPPWEDVFTTIESLNGKDIAVLSLEPEPVSAQVRVGAEARTTEAMLEYLERLRTSARLSPAVLQTHQVMTEDPHRPIRFTFTASWISAKSAQN